MAYEKKEEDLGGLWIKQGAKGEFLSGSISGVPVVCFRNDKKTGNQPDWRVLKSRPRPDAPDMRHGVQALGSPVTDRDIPF